MKEGDPTKLGEAEKFALGLARVPQVEFRLKALQFRIKFAPLKADLKPDIESFKLASLEIQSSKKLAHVFECILEIGNFLNENTPKGGAFGFTLNSLTKVRHKLTVNLNQILVVISM